MPRRPLWQIDMGDGTWSVCCMTCRRPLYRGAKATANRVAAATAASRPPPSPPAGGPDEATSARHLHRMRSHRRTAAPHPGLHIQDESRPYRDRGGELVRVYLTVDLVSTSGDQPSRPAHAGGGRRR